MAKDAPDAARASKQLRFLSTPNQKDDVRDQNNKDLPLNQYQSIDNKNSLQVLVTLRQSNAIKEGESKLNRYPVATVLTAAGTIEIAS